jgi:hypothetical protein
MKIPNEKRGFASLLIDTIDDLANIELIKKNSLDF